MSILTSTEIPARDLFECELRLYALLNSNFTALAIATVQKSSVHRCILEHIKSLEPVLAARGLEIRPIQREVNSVD